MATRNILGSFARINKACFSFFIYSLISAETHQVSVILDFQGYAMSCHKRKQVSTCYNYGCESKYLKITQDMKKPYQAFLVISKALSNKEMMFLSPLPFRPRNFA